MYQQSDNDVMRIISDDIYDVRNSNDDTVIMMSDSYRAVTANSGQVTFVRSHRAPRGIGTIILMLCIIAALTGMTIFGLGAVFGSVIN